MANPHTNRINKKSKIEHLHSLGTMQIQWNIGLWKLYKYQTESITEAKGVIILGNFSIQTNWKKAVDQGLRIIKEKYAF